MHGSVDLSKLSDVVKNKVIKKTAYNTKIAWIEGKIPDISNLATKTVLTTVENKIPDTSSLVKKTNCNAKITDIESKIPDITNLVSKTNLNTKINNVKNEIPSISNLATKTALTAVENKIPNISNLVKITDYNTKITEIEKKHNEYITTPKFNKLAADVFNARLAQANIVTKTDLDTKLSSLNRKFTSNKTRHLLIKKGISYFIGKNYFDEDGTQNYLVFIPIARYFKIRSVIGVIDYVLSWQAKGLSSESIKAVSTSNNSLTPVLDYYDTSKIRVKFLGSRLKQDKSTITHKNIVNIYKCLWIRRF